MMAKRAGPGPASCLQPGFWPQSRWPPHAAPTPPDRGAGTARVKGPRYPALLLWSSYAPRSVLT